MKNKILNSLLMFTLVLLFACGSSGVGNRSMKPVLRAAVDVPLSFEAPEGTVLGDDACKSPLTDPRDGTTITMQSAFNGGVGDYAVPGGMYGVEDGELLRINCNTGEVIGIVER